MKSLSVRALIFSFLAGLMTQNLCAQPHTGSTEKENCVSITSLRRLSAHSESVMVLEVVKVEKGAATRRKFSAVHFKIKDIIKGPPFDRDLKVPYSRGSELPEVQSQWIVFFPKLVGRDGFMYSYKGKHGRLIADEHNLIEVYKLLRNEAPDKSKWRRSE